MKRIARPILSVKGQEVLDHYADVLKQMKGLSAVTKKGSYHRDEETYCFSIYPHESAKKPT